MIRPGVMVFGAIILVAMIVLAVLAFSWLAVRVTDWIDRRRQLRKITQPPE